MRPNAGDLGGLKKWTNKDREDNSMKKLMIEGVDFQMVWLEFTILLSTTVLLLSVALWKFNDKLE